MNGRAWAAGLWLAVTLLAVAALWCSEVPAWKRAAWCRRMCGFRPAAAAPPQWWIDREVQDFMRKVSEYDRH